MKKYSTITILALNFLLNILAIRYINYFTGDTLILVDVLFLIGVVQVFQFGVPVTFSSEIARYGGISRDSSRIAYIILFFTALLLLQYLYFQLREMLILLPILIFIILCNNYRGILEGIGVFWLSHFIKLFTSSIILWLLILIHTSVLMYFLMFSTAILSVFIIFKINKKTAKHVYKEHKYLPGILQGCIVLSALYLDRLILKVYSDPETFVNFTLLQEAAYRPIAVVTIFASYHFYQLNSDEKQVFFTGLRAYVLQVLIAAAALYFICSLELYAVYFEILGFETLVSNNMMFLTWMLLIVTIYLQRVSLALLPWKMAAYVFTLCCVLSSVVGVLVTLHFESAIYSLLARALLECCIMFTVLVIFTCHRLYRRSRND